MTLKTGNQHELDWAVLSGGNVELTIARPGEAPLRADFPPNMVSLFVSEALMAAAGAFDMLKKSGGEPSLFDAELPAVPIEKIALAESNIEGYKTLVLEIGEAQIGFAVPDAALTDFGKLLLSIDK